MPKPQLMVIIGAVALTLSAAVWAGERTVTLKVDGMSCAMCVPAARKALEKVQGVKSAQVAGDRATVITDEQVQEADLGHVIAGAGFSATVLH